MKSFEDLTSRGQVRRIQGLATKALAGYNLSFIKLKPLRHWENTVFGVDDGSEKYALRIHRPNFIKGADYVRSELEWLSALTRDTDLMVPRPITTYHGDSFVEASCDGVPGTRCCVVFRWVEGRFRHPDQLTAASIEKVGTFMAQLHLHATHFTPSADFVRPLQDYVDADSKPMLNGLDLATQLCSVEDAAFLRSTYRQLQRALNTIGREPEKFNLIHADLHPWNYLFHQGEVRAIDFDDCGWGHFMYDIAVSLLELEYRQDFLHLKEAFFKGYRGIRPLTKEDGDLLPVFFAARRLWLMAWTAGRSDHPELREAAANTVGYTVERLQEDAPFNKALDGNGVQGIKPYSDGLT